MSLRLLKEKKLSIAVLMTAAICMADLFTPLWFDVWVLYLIPLFFMFQSAKRPYFYSVIVTVLVAAGLFLSPGDNTPFMHAAINRLTGICGGWGVSFLLMRLRSLHASLLQNRTELEKRVEDRTTELLQANLSLQNDIAERKNIEEALRDSEENYRLLFNKTPIGIFNYDTQLILTAWNDYFMEILQSSREKLLGLDMKTLKDQSVIPAIRKAIEGEEGHYEGFYRATTGVAEIWVSMSTAPSFDKDGKVKGGVGIMQDITERNRAEDALRRSEEKYRSLVESTDDSIYVVDRNYRYLHMNRKHIARMEFSGDEYIGRAYGEFHGDKETRLFIRDVDKVFETGQSIRREFKSNRDNKYFVQTLSPVKNAAGQSVAVTIISKDITEHKNMEEKLRALSLTDELTGLYNRRGFFTFCDRTLKVCRREKKGAFLLYADLDNLKEINDRLGHQEGDKMLAETADIFKKTFRDSDIIARIGGDEFIVFPVGNTKEDSEVITNRLLRNIENDNAKKARNKYVLSVSFGTSYYDPGNPCSIDELIAEAEKLMYARKKDIRF
ncbi:MAG TPA: diguanylate cyclase [Syntrophales bacterium]|nr:diguanylate cyclase [Syntrophales bacterium]